MAYLVGYDDESQISRLEGGSRLPRLPELLVIELLSGAAASTIFPEFRRRVGSAAIERLERLQAELGQSDLAHPRVAYKSAQLTRVLASLKNPDRLQVSENLPWKPVLASDTEAPER